jgi:hypothetical protein
VGAPAVVSGESYLTGNGKLSAPNGSGNADRFVGNAGGTDSTHPPRPGHAHIASIMGGQLSLVYS